MITIPGKDIVYCDKDGNYNLYSAEEVLTNRLNNWLGWKCSAGVDIIHITADGNIFAGTCKVGGLLGNVFDTEVNFLEEWQTCTKAFCMCGSEMKIFKLRPSLDETSHLSHAKNYTTDAVVPEWIGPASLKVYAGYPKTITWDLGRRCNFSCSYCPPSTANNFEAHKSFESLKFAVDSIFNKYTKNLKAKWIFTGGEPTINPAYMDLVKYIQSKGHIIHTQSNGSRDPKYYSELIDFSSIGFSVHFEEFNEKRLLENCEAIISRKQQSKDASICWFGVRLMVPPGGFEKALALKVKLLALASSLGAIDSIDMSPLYTKEDGEKLLNYSIEELININLHI